MTEDGDTVTAVTWAAEEVPPAMIVVALVDVIAEAEPVVPQPIKNNRLKSDAAISADLMYGDKLPPQAPTGEQSFRDFRWELCSLRSERA